MHVLDQVGDAQRRIKTQAGQPVPVLRLNGKLGGSGSGGLWHVGALVKGSLDSTEPLLTGQAVN